MYLVILLVVIVVLVVYKYGAPLRHHGVKNVVHGYPILGNLIFFMRNFRRFQDLIATTAQSFNGETFLFNLPRIGPFRHGAYAVGRPDCVEHILGTNFANYEKGANFHDTLEPFFGDGIFSTDGAAWVHQRKIASHMFSQRLMREGLRVAIMQGERLMHNLAAHATAGTAVDVQDQFFRFTIDTFGFIAFGLDLASLERDHPFTVAFDRTAAICNNRFENPLWQLGQALRTPSERELTRHATTINAFVDGVVAARRREADEGAPLGPDLLSRFLDDGVAKGTPVSNKELRDVVLNFIIAGRDTTACALSWAMFELCRHPDVAAKCRAEVDLAIPLWRDQGGGQGRGAMPLAELPAHDLIEYAQLNDALPYLTATISEVLRLHPSVPKQAKWARAADVLPDGTHIPAGAAILYSAFSMGRDATLWPEPLAFRPERWLNAPTPSAFTNIVFNAGPRLCLGKPLAYMEIKLALAMVLSRFTFTADSAVTEEYVSSLVMPMKYGMPVTLRHRADLPASTNP